MQIYCVVNCYVSPRYGGIYKQLSLLDMYKVAIHRLLKCKYSSLFNNLLHTRNQTSSDNNPTLSHIADTNARTSFCENILQQTIKLYTKQICCHFVCFPANFHQSALSWFSYLYSLLTTGCIQLLRNKLHLTVRHILLLGIFCCQALCRDITMPLWFTSLVQFPLWMHTCMYSYDARTVLELNMFMNTA